MEQRLSLIDVAFFQEVDTVIEEARAGGGAITREADDGAVRI